MIFTYTILSTIIKVYIFIIALFVRQELETIYCLSIVEWINTLRQSYTMELYLTEGMSDIQPNSMDESREED
jgi:hypothetical protein